MKKALLLFVLTYSYNAQACSDGHRSQSAKAPHELILQESAKRDELQKAIIQIIC